MKEIKLGGFKHKGFIALVDDKDFKKASEFKWHLHSKGYVSTTLSKFASPVNKQRTLKLHNLILPSVENLQVDHINHNKLDNRRANLRLVTQYENICNSRKLSKSGFKGIYYDKRKGKWRASITCKGKKYSCGYFKNPKDAALAYDLVAKKLYGSFASLNFPNN